MILTTILPLQKQELVVKCNRYWLRRVNRSGWCIVLPKNSTSQEIKQIDHSAIVNAKATPHTHLIIDCVTPPESFCFFSHMRCKVLSHCFSDSVSTSSPTAIRNVYPCSTILVSLSYVQIHTVLYSIYPPTIWHKIKPDSFFLSKVSILIFFKKIFQSFFFININFRDIKREYFKI